MLVAAQPASEAIQHGRSRFLTVVLWLGMAFLYIPLILLVVYSFNYSKLVPVWGGWSLRWYVVLFQSATRCAGAGTNGLADVAGERA